MPRKTDKPKLSKLPKQVQLAMEEMAEIEP
jgi:hypothetical protein